MWECIKNNMDVPMYTNPTKYIMTIGDNINAAK